MVVCVPYTSTLKGQWDLFIEQSRTPLFFFKRDFLEYHADRFFDHSLMFYEDNQLLAVLPATKNNNMLISHGGLTFGGLVLSQKIRAETIKNVLDCLIKMAQQLRLLKIMYKAIPYIFYTQGAQEDLYFMVNDYSARLVRRDLSSVIYLDNRLKLSKGKKWLVARAKKMNLEVANSKDYHQFHKLLSQVLEKYDTRPVHSVDELERLSVLFPDNIFLKIVKYKDELVAAALLFIFNTTVHTQYLATNDLGKELGALDFLIETCINESQRENYKYFSFGISTEQQGKYLNLGLMAQKEGFGARGVALDFYEVGLS